ncbi:hypothetical protein Vadar_013211 [Vaccinium darrowii]|uniref:Uncharacterized protein n=1 Tax=Vaccinium darrowii TaxID=229202 RepID=A0ACB7ZLC9_9ERIC|nr:hypothetical protein Vadar_013211 [Vaccinium darrowii]
MSFSPSDTCKSNVIHMDKSATLAFFSTHHSWYESTLSFLSSMNEGDVPRISLNLQPRDCWIQYSFQSLSLNSRSKCQPILLCCERDVRSMLCHSFCCERDVCSVQELLIEILQTHSQWNLIGHQVSYPENVFSLGSPFNFGRKQKQGSIINIPTMSCFLDILRCILCIDGDDDREEDTWRRNSNRNYSPYYDTSYRSYVPTTSTATTPLISTHLTRKPSDACTASPICTPNYSNSWNSTPTKLPDKSRAATQKPTNPLLPPSPSTTKISLNKAVNSATNKTSTPKFPQGLSSFPSQPSAPLTKLLASSSKIQQPSDAFSTTRVPTSISWNSTPTKLPETLNVSFVKPKATIDSSVVIKSEASIRTSDKSCEATQKLKDSILPPSLFSTEISREKAIDSGTNKSSAQILSHRLSSFSPQPSPSLTKLVASSSKPLSSVSMPPPPPVSSSSSSSFGPPPSSPKPLQRSTKPILSLAPSNPTDQNSKTTYIWVEKGTSPIYAIPEDFKDLIKNNVVPGILKRPLSPSTYKDYFEALLYAEDFYIEIMSSGSIPSTMPSNEECGQEEVLLSGDEQEFYRIQVTALRVAKEWTLQIACDMDNNKGRTISSFAAPNLIH